jgi:hypothetical protein
LVQRNELTEKQIERLEQIAHNIDALGGVTNR